VLDQLPDARRRLLERSLVDHVLVRAVEVELLLPAVDGHVVAVRPARFEPEATSGEIPELAPLDVRIASERIAPLEHDVGRYLRRVENRPHHRPNIGRWIRAGRAPRLT